MDRCHPEKTREKTLGRSRLRKSRWSFSTIHAVLLSDLRVSRAESKIALIRLVTLSYAKPADSIHEALKGGRASKGETIKRGLSLFYLIVIATCSRTAMGVSRSLSQLLPSFPCRSGGRRENTYQSINQSDVDPLSQPMRPSNSFRSLLPAKRLIPDACADS
jgi:hypothetical protein